MKKYLLLLLASAFLAGCASTEYKPYEGKNTVLEGSGGTKTVVAGIDFWENGEPPRKFKLMGFIEDSRPVNLIQMISLKKDIAKKAKEIGADAVIMVTSNSQVIGYRQNITSNTQFYGSNSVTQSQGNLTPMSVNQAKFAVISYVKEP